MIGQQLKRLIKSVCINFPTEKYEYHLSGFKLRIYYKQKSKIVSKTISDTYPVTINLSDPRKLSLAFLKPNRKSVKIQWVDVEGFCFCK